VTVGAGQVGVGVQERRLDHQHVGVPGEVVDGGAEAGVHHEREPLAGAWLAHLLQAHGAPSDLDPALVLQTADVGAGDPRRGEAVGEHAPPVRLLQPVTERLDGMVEPGRPQRPTQAPCHHAVAHHGFLAHVRRLVERRGAPQAPEELRARRRVVRDDAVGHAVQGEPLHDSRYAEAVVAVEVGDTDARDVGGADARQLHLPLRALAGVEEEPLAVPAQQVPVVVALAGRSLARRPQYDQLTQ
jgi:hypothetical protein